MSTNPSPSAQREALEQAEKKANEKQPGSYKDEETDDKVVEIPPTGPGQAADSRARLVTVEIAAPDRASRAGQLLRRRSDRRTA